ncbi:MAG: isoprenylcysteine carboxylmethyltransferase family protein [Gammaproteobacteria bacterium]|nr:isoprenylcysteine carboxylmethyltransferase family protein [Gammaproteobacteria bacterium]
MKPYQRIFGAGPRGASISIALLLVAYLLAEKVGFGCIISDDLMRYLVVSVFGAFGLVITVWSLISLSLDKRGRSLVTSGAFKYFRHPLYAAFLLFYNMGFAIFLNNWIYIVWSIVLIPIWSLNVRSEENSMKKEFGEEYEAYCRRTWKFFPKLHGET